MVKLFQIKNMPGNILPSMLWLFSRSASKLCHPPLLYHVDARTYSSIQSKRSIKIKLVGKALIYGFLRLPWRMATCGSTTACLPRDILCLMDQRTYLGDLLIILETNTTQLHCIVFIT